ncbi:MAG: TIGR03905 family TSCPD domain-containing protein [Clostridia bacterium]|nr:TIGR03905 family TSCPD domain-containing protein [Clostridia bacterium]
MSRHISYATKGTCSVRIDIDLADDNTILDVAFTGGCNGNTKGISELVRGMKAEDVIERLSGIRCGMKPTSCPDQLSKALRQAVGE